jgi:hypothetical protein
VVGEKKILKVKDGEIDEIFLKVIKEHTAGSPVDEEIKWTNLTKNKIVELMNEEGCNISITIVNQLLKKHNYKKRKPFKYLPGGKSKNRNEQFININKLKDKYKSDGNPVLSMDVKQKELIGNFSRGGELYTQGRIYVNDHDFRSQSKGVAIPHGLYDMSLNLGYITIGTSHDTSEFACECILKWWKEYGRENYPNATSILILCDCGGSNNARYYIFKKELIALSNMIGIEIRIAHYPPYCSKYNPIEHRLFPHVTRVCKGMIFDCLKTVKDAIAKTSTKTGLKVFVSVLDKTFQTGLKVADGFKENMKVNFDSYLPKLNYSVRPLKN